MATRKLEVLITGDASSLEKSLGKTQTAATGFAAKFGKVAKIGGVVGIAVGGAAVALGKTVSAAQESEKAQARLTQALKGAGISQAKYGKSIEDNINKTSRLAALDDEDLSDSFAKLVRATGDVTRATEGMNLAADIARARNISLEAATKMVERAQIGNAAAFSKVGIQIVKSSEHLGAAKKEIDSWRDSNGKLTEAEKEKGKALLDTARTLDKQASAAKAFEEAQKRFATGAEDYGKTSAAAQERIKVALENVQEVIGAKVLPIVATLAEKLLEFLNWAIVNWPRFQKVIEGVMEKVRTAFDKVRPALDALFDTVEAFVGLVVALFKGDWSEAWEQFKKVVSSALSAIKEIITLAWEGVKTVAVKLGGKIIEGLKEGLTGIGSAAWGLINNIGERITDFHKTILGWGANIAKAVVTGLLDGLTGLGKKIVEKIKDAFDWVRDHMPKLPSIDIPFIGGGPGENGAANPPSRSTPGAGMGLSSRIVDDLAFGSSMGLSLSSGRRGPRFPGDSSDHITGHAIDMVGSPGAMAAFARAVMSRPGIKDVFYDPLGYSLDNGKFWGATIGGHSDHVHVSTFDKGGWLKPGLTLAYNGTGRPERVGGAGGDIHFHFPNYVGDKQELLSAMREAAATFTKQNNRSAFA